MYLQSLRPIEKLMKNKIVLVIAHRLSTIKKCDNIVVMNHGNTNILEMGTHDQLLNKKGVYYNLYHQ